MELREFAEKVLLSKSLEEKLELAPGEWTDERPGESTRAEWPGRPPELRIDPKRRGVRMPKAAGFTEPRLRGVAHHIMANHELQALEVMAWMLLAFPDAPARFRLEMAAIMRDEQRHARMHIRRAGAHGVPFGSLSINGYVWKKAMGISNLLDYLSCIPLTLEGGNLDHTLEFARRFEKAGDGKSAEVMRAIHHDEIEHVAFGVRWLKELKDPGQSEWKTYLAHLHEPLKPIDATGRPFDRPSRIKAGLTEEFVDHLEKALGEEERSHAKAVE